MTNRSSREPAPDTPLNPPDAPLDQKQRELEGDRPPDQQSAYIDRSDADALDRTTTTDIYEGELPDGDDPRLGDVENLDLMTELELRAEETDDPIEAVEEGFTYIPPIDPPVVPGGGLQNAEIASGLGLSALDEPYDADHHSSFLSADDEMSARVREALRADSSTSAYADAIGVATRGGVVIVRGVVDDMLDSDNIQAVAEYVEGVTEVIDELRIRGLE